MVEAFVLVRVQPRRIDDIQNFMASIKEEISKVEGVKDVKGVFGRYDFVIVVETKTLPELGKLVTHCIRGIKGVAETETLTVGF